jgi:hypothetical protein
MAPTRLRAAGEHFAADVARREAPASAPARGPGPARHDRRLGQYPIVTPVRRPLKIEPRY